MAVPFDEIPANVLVPLFYGEVKPAQHPFNETLKLLLVGHKNAANGNATVDTPYILSGSLAQQLFGRGSMLHSMYQLARDNAPFIEIWGMATTPSAGGVAATGTITISTAPSATKSGMLSILIAGRRVEVPARPTDTQAQVAARLKNKITAQGALPVTAALNASDDTVIDLTCKWVGASGNDININRKYWGRDNRTAVQLTTIAQLSGGIGNAGITPALGALGDQKFDVFAIGHQMVTTQLNSLDDFLDGSSGRWSPFQQLYGHAFGAFRKGYSDMITLADARNGPHVSLIPMSLSPGVPWDWSATWAAKATQHWAAPPDISRPLHSLHLKGLLPPADMADWFDQQERQALLESGACAWVADDDRKIRINRTVTSYKTNVWGDPDASWRDANTMFQAMYFVRRMRAAITGAFPRAALTTEDTNIPGFASPGKIRDVLIHEYKALERSGLVEKSDLFAEALIVERDEVDANRVNVLMRPDVVNQLRIVAALVETHLELTADKIALNL